MFGVRLRDNGEPKYVAKGNRRIALGVSTMVLSFALLFAGDLWTAKVFDQNATLTQTDYYEVVAYEADTVKYLDNDNTLRAKNVNIEFRDATPVRLVKEIYTYGPFKDTRWRIERAESSDKGR